MGKSRVTIVFLVIWAILSLSPQEASSEPKTELSLMQEMKGVTVVSTEIPVGNICIPCTPSKYQAEAIGIEATAMIVYLLDNISDCRTGISLDFEKAPKATVGFGFAFLDKEEVEGLIKAMASMVNICHERQKFRTLYAEKTSVSYRTKSGFEVTSKYHEKPEFAYMNIRNPALEKLDLPKLDFQHFEILHLEKFAEFLSDGLEILESKKQILNVGE